MNTIEKLAGFPTRDEMIAKINELIFEVNSMKESETIEKGEEETISIEDLLGKMVNKEPEGKIDLYSNEEDSKQKPLDIYDRRIK